MKTKNKRIPLLLMVLVMALNFTACNDESSVDNLPKEVNVGILRVPNDESIAIQQGLFDKAFEDKGITCNFIVFDSGVDANKALASGDIDFASMGNTNAIVAASLGLDVEMIWIHEVLGDVEALVVKDGSGIESLQDLEGKKIATPFASTSHYSLLNALKEAGIKDKVELLDMQTTEIVAAWERGDIEAAYTWQPSLGQLMKSGKTLITSEDMANKGYTTANVKLVRKEFAEKYPELVSDYISCLAEAGDIYRGNPEQGAEIVAKELGITTEEALLQMQGSLWLTPEELLTEQYLGTSDSSGDFTTVMKDTADFLEDQDSISKAPSQEAFNEFVNPYYIEQAIRGNE